MSVRDLPRAQLRSCVISVDCVTVGEELEVVWAHCPGYLAFRLDGGKRIGLFISSNKFRIAGASAGSGWFMVRVAIFQVGAAIVVLRLGAVAGSSLSWLWEPRRVVDSMQQLRRLGDDGRPRVCRCRWSLFCVFCQAVSYQMRVGACTPSTAISKHVHRCFKNCRLRMKAPSSDCRQVALNSIRFGLISLSCLRTPVYCTK